MNLMYSCNLINSILLQANNYVTLISIFNCSLEPSSHINAICRKALKILGFIIVLRREFPLNNGMKKLYCALMNPI